MDPVFCCLVEVRPLAGCALDPAEVAGAYVRCYAQASDVAEAQQKILEALTAARFAIVEFGWSEDTRRPGWEAPDPAEAEQCAAQAARTGAVVPGRFDTWAPDPPGFPL